VILNVVNINDTHCLQMTILSAIVTESHKIVSFGDCKSIERLQVLSKISIQISFYLVNYNLYLLSARRS